MEKNILAHKLDIYRKEMAVCYKTHYLVLECVRAIYETDLVQVNAGAAASSVAANEVTAAMSM